MKKKELRKKYSQKRETLSHDRVLLLSQQISERLLASFDFKKSQKVHIFLSVSKKKEFETGFLINYFFRNGIRVFVPKMVEDRLISIEIFEDTEFLVNSWGIKEPQTNEDSCEFSYDYVITPLLYCDNSGNRVGYGKGFYDGFFRSVSPDVKKIGVGFFSPDEQVEDVWENDVRIDYLVTPEEVLSFTALV